MRARYMAVICFEVSWPDFIPSWSAAMVVSSRENCGTGSGLRRGNRTGVTSAVLESCRNCRRFLTGVLFFRDASLAKHYWRRGASKRREATTEDSRGERSEAPGTL